MNQESTSLSRIVNYYWKFVSTIQNSEISHNWCKRLRDDTEIKTKEAFHTLKKSLNETAHLVISQSACEKILKINTSNFVINACLY
jgi:hypothetical protein